MPDEFTTPPPRRGGALALVLVALALGGGALGWMGWQRGLHVATLFTAHSTHAPGAGTLAPSEARIAALEQRLAQIDLAAQAAAGKAARAEALLTAFAARRAIERGRPLGYLDAQLKLRFGDALPNAVALVSAAGRQPMTRDLLGASLARLGPQLVPPPAAPGTWQSFKADLGNLFVIRHRETPRADPAERLNHARMCLGEGQLDQAIAEVRQMSASPAAQAWLAAAARYQEVERALDLLETTALLEPRALNDGEGRRVPAGAGDAMNGAVR